MIISRKKLIIILIFLLIICFILMYKDNQYSERKTKQTIPASGTPVSNHTIILDAGHGKPDRWSSVR